MNAARAGLPSPSSTSGRRRRRVAVITGTRAEYGLLTSALRAIQKHPRLELQLVVTGMHLLPAFGHTLRDIIRDGWPIAARVPMQRGGDEPGDQAQGLARGVAGISKYLIAARSDVVMVLGDRIEALAGALAAVTTGRVLAHIHGGDVAPGDFDDSLRHAITKLAHVHFPATREAARRIVRLGESPRRVHVVGGVGLDRLRELRSAAAPRFRSGSKEPASRAKPDSSAALVIYHACGRSAEFEGRVMSRVLNAVQERGLRRIVLYPNTDRGHSGVIAALEAHRRSSPAGEVEVHRSLPRDDYLRLLMRVRLLVGNSSSGIIEAPAAGKPAVNVGPRQAGRQASGPGVFNVGETLPAIRAGLTRALRHRSRPGRRTVYGDGQAGARIARTLARLQLGPAATRKVIAY